MPHEFTLSALQRERCLSLPEEAGKGFKFLTNEIHPLFAYSNFCGPWVDEKNLEFSEEDYEFLKLAFRLATKYITEDSCLKWWCTLVRGKTRYQRCHEGHNERMVLSRVDADEDGYRSVRNFKASNGA
jgi:hypothetical protein